MNFYLLSIIAFGVFVAILYLKSSEHQRMLYSQKYVRDKVSGTLGFDKFEENHLQRAYKNEEIIELLKNAGFDYIKTYGDFKLEAPKQDSERVFFVCKK